MILAIDSAIGTAVAVVADDGRVLAECASSDTRGHAEAVGLLIVEALAAAGATATAVTAADVTAVAAGVGPGPFTGLRVGIAAARAFAVGRGVPLVAVRSHDAVAIGPAADGPIVVLSDARRRERSWSAYAGLDAAGLPALAAGPGLTAVDGLDAQLGALASAARIEATAVPAGALGRIAATRLAMGIPSDGLEPLYLRSPDVTLSAGPKRVST